MKKFTILLLLIIAQTAFGQSFSVFDVDTNSFPKITAKFYAFNAAGDQITNLNDANFEVWENGTQRPGIQVLCPPMKSPKALSSVLVMDVSGSMGSGVGSTINIELAKAAARAWVNALPLGKSECAISTFDQNNYMNRDFTTDKVKLLDAIAPLAPSGGTDYDAALINTIAGGLVVSKGGKYQKVIVLLTDGQADTEQIEKIVSEAKSQKCVIYTVTLGMNCPQILKDIAIRTDGQWFENVTTMQEAEHIYRTILQTAQDGKPCSIEWQSGLACSVGVVDATVKLLPQNLISNVSYITPKTAIAKLEFNPSSVKFADPQVNIKTEQTVTVIARNADFTIEKIESNNGAFELIPKGSISIPTTLKAGESMDFTVSYLPADRGYNYCRFDIQSQPCATRFYVSGGWKGVKPFISTLKLIRPNGDDVFVAGSDTIIIWDGVGPDDLVKLEYSTNNGADWIFICDTAKNLSYNWRIPATPSNQCLARVTAAVKNNEIFDNEMVLIPAGTFQMGNTGKYSGAVYEKPVHKVTISRDFLISKYEITQAQYEKVMGANPSEFKGANLPVEQVSWYNAVEFCNKLSDMQGMDKCYIINGTIVQCDWEANGYRLPTEAEWEYACKAGTTTDYYSGSLTYAGCGPKDASLDQIGWYCVNPDTKSHEIGLKAPNNFGLYDMSGNVFEWCWDMSMDITTVYSSAEVTDPKGATSGDYRISRGGGWASNASDCRSSYRHPRYPSYRNNFIGFRVVTNK